MLLASGWLLRCSIVAASFSNSAAVLDLDHPKNYSLNVMVRLPAGVSLEAARGRLRGHITGRLTGRAGEAFK